MNKIDAINDSLTNDVLERSILSCLINSPDLYYQGTNIEDYFFNHENKKIYQSIRSLIIKEKTVDESMIIGKLGADYQDKIMELSVMLFTTAGYFDYVDQLAEHYKVRKLKSIGGSMELVSVDNIGDAIDGAYKQIGELMGTIEKEKTMEECINSVLENAGKPESRIGYFGYPEIDSRTFGIKPGKFTILMARPSVGKTLLAVNIASNLMDQQVKSLILSGEMLSEEVVQRFISIRYGIKPYIFESKPGIEIMNMIASSGKDDFAYIPEYIKVSDKPLVDYIMYQSIYNAYHKDGIRVVIIDYLQIATGSGKQQNKATEIGAISAKIKRICNELRINIIGLAQISREGAKSGKMSLEYLKDSGNLEQDADIVIGLDKEEDEKGHLKKVGMHILKNRGGGGLGEFRYLTDGGKITNKITKP